MSSVMAALSALQRAEQILKKTSHTFYRAKAVKRGYRSWKRGTGFVKAYKTQRYKDRKRVGRYWAGRRRLSATRGWPSGSRPPRAAPPPGMSFSALDSDNHEGLSLSVMRKPITVSCQTPKFAYVPKLTKTDKLLFRKYVCRMAQVKESDGDITSGSYSLTHNNTTGEVPYHLYSLGTIHNDNTNGTCGFSYNQNGTFTALAGATMSRIAYAGLMGNENSELYTGAFRRAEINLMLYNNTTKSTHYTITFFKILDPSMDPNRSYLGLDGYNNEKIQNLLNPVIAKRTQSPCLNHPRYSNGKYQMHGKRRVRILKTFDFHLREKLSSEDATFKKVCKFVLYPNQQIDWDLGHHGQTTLTDITGDSTALGVSLLQGGNQISECPRSTQNIFMSVMCDDFKHDGEDADNNPGGTYDIDFTNYFDVREAHA